MSPGIRPSIEDTVMEIAFTVSKRSTCSRRQNGAVIADSRGVVLSTGYNGSLSGQQHCDHECECDYELKKFVAPKGIEPEHENSCSAHPQKGCTTAVHAEANSVYFAARNGISVAGAQIFCTTEPCVKCAEAIVQSGIKKVFYAQEYRIHTGIELLQSAEIAVERLDPGTPTGTRF